MKLVLAISSLFVVSTNAHSQLVASPRTGSPIQTIKPAPDVKSVVSEDESDRVDVDYVVSEDESDRVDVDYGFPLTTGALIVEYPYWTSDPPGTWDNGNNPFGSFAFLGHLPGPDPEDRSCPPIPEGSPLQAHNDVLKPLSVPRKSGVDACMLTCNLTETKSSGVDVCNAGSIQLNSNSVMSCYDLGEMYTGDATLGACGYNCTAMLTDGTGCTEEDVGSGGCHIYCNTNDGWPAAKDVKEEPAEVEDVLGSTCTRSHEFCCEAPAGDPANCAPSTYTDDCAAKNSCCCG